jgi:ABC-type nitrate/sulfonate/bicarbonate transport system substrate-binding protein
MPAVVPWDDVFSFHQEVNVKFRAMKLSGLAVLVTVCFIAFYFLRANWSAPVPEAIRIAMPRHALSALIYIADDQHYFEDEGLSVTLVPSPYGKDALNMMLAGNAEFSTSASLPVSSVILDGAEPRLLATLAKSDQSHVILANGKHHIAQPADLSGKTVAVKLGTTLQFYLDVLLIDAGVHPSDVKTVDLGGEEAMAALRKGTIDAAVEFAPVSSATLASPDLVPVPFSPTLYTTHWNLVSTARMLKDRPGVAEKLLRALISAQEFALDNPQQAIALTAKRTAIPLPDLAPYWPQYVFQVRLPQSLIVTMEDETRWANSRRNAASPSMPTPNFLDYLDSGPLSRVKPDAVRITQ